MRFLIRPGVITISTILLLCPGPDRSFAVNTQIPMVDIQEQYQPPDRNRLNRAMSESVELGKRIFKVEGRLGKHKIPEEVRLQFRKFKKSYEDFFTDMEMLARSSEGRDDDTELILRLRNSLKVMYLEAVLLNSINKKQNIMRRTKKSRLKKILVQIRLIASEGGFVILP